MEPAHSLFTLGRVAETRLWAAKGMAVGLYPRGEVEAYLESSWEYADGEWAALGLQHEMDGAGSLVPPLHSTDMLLEEARGDAYSAQGVRAFQDALSIRSGVNMFRKASHFVALCLFADAVEWEARVSEAQEFAYQLTHWGEGPHFSGDAWGRYDSSSLFLDGAYEIALLSSSVLAEAALGRGVDGSPWPFLADEEFLQLVWDASRLVSMVYRSDVPTPLTVRKAVAASGSRDPEAQEAFRRIFYMLQADRLLAWCTAPFSVAGLDLPSTARMARERPPVASMSPMVDASMAVNAEPSLAWASLMWRVAPTDARSNERYGTVVPVVLEVLQAALRSRPLG